MVTLKVVESENPALQGRTFTLEGNEVDLGRSRDCGVVLDDMTVSRRHAKFVSSGGGWSVVDAGSGNGTWVNGQKVPETPLKNGDKVRVGRIVVQIEGLADVDGTMLLNEPDERTAALGPNVMPPMPPPRPAPAPAPAQRPPVQSPFPEAEPAASSPAPFPPPRPAAPTYQPPQPPQQPFQPVQPVQPVHPPQPPYSPPPVVPAAPPAASFGPETPAFPPPSPRVAPAAPPFPPPAPRPAPRPASPAPVPIPDVAAHPRGAVQRPAPVRPPAAMAGALHGTPGGFWARFGAYLLDSILLTLLIGIVIVPIVFLSGALNDPSKLAGVFLLAQLLAMVIALGYTLYFWATSGATPGKRVLGLKIVREDGVEPLGFKTAFVRFLGYIVSGMILYIGFLMIAFDKDKKGLHDKIAKTRVIKPE